MGMYGLNTYVSEVTGPAGLEDVFIERAMDMEDSLYDIEMSEEHRETLIDHIYSLYESVNDNIVIIEDEELGEYREPKYKYKLKSDFRP
mmetsp:Transcript_40440/g.38922  ORF Transcript_40440/g.38922 Transcript_40440/m.38922 type:complete len:89 (+) Transcript_40440:477-743(+)